MVSSERLRTSLKEIDNLQSSVDKIRINLSTLKNSNGQVTSTVLINGVQFNISTLDRESGWMPYTVDCYKNIQIEAIKITEVFLQKAVTALEDAKFKYIQMSKEI